MTLYDVNCKSMNYHDTFYSVADARRKMKELIKAGYEDVVGFKTKVYANGDWVPCGLITLTGNNKTYIANSPHNMQNKNY